MTAGQMSEGLPRVWWLAGETIDDLSRQVDERERELTAGKAPDADAFAIPAGGPMRLAIVDPDDRKVKLARRLLASGKPWRGRSDVWFTTEGLADQGGKVAFVFPGVEPTFGAGGTDLPSLAALLGMPAPDTDESSLTRRSRSLVMLGVFLFDVLERFSVEPDHLAGHSLGEWSAAVAAGTFDRPGVSRLLDMLDVDQFELPDVDFAALGCGAEAAMAVVGDHEGIELSHDNCPHQSVICGPPAAVDRALEALKAVNLLGYKLDFQSGFHTSALEPHLPFVRQVMDHLNVEPARVPLWSATIADRAPDDPGAAVDLHLRHLVQTVRFRELVDRLYDEGVRIFVQPGIGSLLGFVNDTLGDRPHLSVDVLQPKRSAVAQLVRMLSALWAEGVPFDLDPLLASASSNAEPSAAAPATPTTAAAPAPTPVVPAPVAPSAPAPVPDPTPTPAPVAPPAAAPLVTVGAAPAPAAATAPAVATGTALRDHQALAIATELIANAARANHDVLTAWTARVNGLTPSAPAPAPPPVLRAPASAPADLAPPVPTPPIPTSPPATAPPVETGVPAWPTSTIKIVRPLSLEARPETLDHRLYRLPEGWPDPTDGFPIIAMTTQLDLLAEIAREYGGGRDVVELSNVRNFTWFDLSDPVDLEVTIAPVSDDTLKISLGRFCRANVRLGRHAAPARYEAAPLKNPHPAPHTGAEMFSERIMFHGPAYQGITAMGPIGDDGMFGEIDNLPTPGALLDDVGKLIAYWVLDRQSWHDAPLPLGVDRVEFFGPPLPSGTLVHCDVRIQRLEPDMVKADATLVAPNGDVWCEIEGWMSHVFHMDDVMYLVTRFPERNAAALREDGGWLFVPERWPTGAGRDLTARTYLRRDERAVYDNLNLLQQRHHLLEQIAAKESLRHRIHAEGLESYPVEIVVEPDGSDGRFRVTAPGRDSVLRVAVGHIQWIAATVSTEDPVAPLDIEIRGITEDDDPDETLAAAVAAVQERQPGAPVSRAIREIEPSEWVSVTAVAVAWTGQD